METVNLNNYISNNGSIIYIFLDVDGVLNSENYIIKCYKKHHKPMHMNHVPFDPKCLNNLMLLVQALEKHTLKNVKIILSSTWRLHEVDYEIVNARLAEYGLTLSGKTSYIHGERGKEIKEYLDSLRYKCYNFIILDDDINDIIPYFSNNLIRTTSKTGFSKRYLNKALKFFNIEEEVR